MIVRPLQDALGKVSWQKWHATASNVEAVARRVIAQTAGTVIAETAGTLRLNVSKNLDTEVQTLSCTREWPISGNQGKFAPDYILCKKQCLMPKVLGDMVCSIGRQHGLVQIQMLH